MLCPFCKSEMIGNEGSRVCSNVSCLAYETNKDNYDKPMVERNDIKKSVKKLIKNKVIK